MTRPWEHQRRALEFIKRRKKCLIAMDMGTGKTRAIVDLVCDFPRPRYVLVASPLSVIDVWPEQFGIHGSQPTTVVPLSAGSVAKRAQLARDAINEAPPPVVIVINHESVWRSDFGKLVTQIPWDMAIVDESHKLKAPGGRGSLFMSKIANNKGMPHPPYRIGLTGTPLPHSPLDAYAQGRFIDASVFGFSFTRFRARYAVMGGYKNKQVIDWQNMDDFNRRLNGMTFRVSADDVLDLPPVQHIARVVKLSSKEQTRYTEMEQQLVTQIRSREVVAANALVKLLRLQQITGSGVDENKPAKYNELVELFDCLPPREPVVVFARFREDLRLIHLAAAQTGRSSSELSGSRKELDEWKQGKTDVLTVQIESGGVGVDLTRARYAVYYSLGFSLGDYMQSLARLHRPGQDKPVVYYHLISQRTIDEKVYKALKKKEDVVQSVVGALS